MNSKFYVTLEAARLLKEKGYNEEAYAVIDEDSEILECICRMNQDMPDWQWACPTKAEAIDWLESKGICISIIFCELEMYEFVVESKYGYCSVVESGYKGTRLEAEDAAIIEALKLL